ncbi:GNAT family N-acetyltransferase [Jeongeupia naejangsanensis]|uniref:GNAT family N-acetyltransferase n=1 Tax=Jeongeupia naejangsanensis TaxID=613195 RepID=A0ABS2BM85_9NEIS|nr:GNAT family N-acetyltransferase [Jeongeupia naejangsanensis]MBM3116106.1 GNAT family N-acetyltransferase [Jeongeupia naejangsanensis]
MSLHEVTRDNWYACAALRVSAEQLPHFPFSVLEWIAESKFEPSFRLRAIHAGGDLVGFAVLGKDPDTGEDWIVMLMIDAQHQRRGHGKAAMLRLIDELAAQGGKRILIGHRPANVAASALYAALGFVEVERNDAEIVRALGLR